MTTIRMLAPFTADNGGTPVVPGGRDNEVPPVSSAVFDRLPEDVKPLMRHWVRD